MKEFFQVTDIETVLALRDRFAVVSQEQVPLNQALGCILVSDLRAQSDIPGFDRSTMDGFAVCASSTYGASDGNPAYLTVLGSVQMGQTPDISLGPGQAVRIATGGMLPAGADSVVMVEHSALLDETTIEVFRSVAPGQHVVAKDEDAARGQVLLPAGWRLRPQDLGYLAANGICSVDVRRRPLVGILSTGDEIVPISETPQPGQVRDVNSYTLAGLVRDAGARPVPYGIVKDRYDDLLSACRKALAETDMVLVSGGSSMGMRDLTVDVLAALPESSILAHGVNISPGKPTILAQCGPKAFWGLPGHVTSAMVVFLVLVRPFLSHIAGLADKAPVTIKARLTRNLPSAQGRVDYIRVRLIQKEEAYWAEPVLGASGLIRTMVEADGLIAVEMNCEGLEKGAQVDVRLH